MLVEEYDSEEREVNESDVFDVNIVIGMMEKLKTGKNVLNTVI
jgi:hypothetical protein